MLLGFGLPGSHMCSADPLRNQSTARSVRKPAQTRPETRGGVRWRARAGVAGDCGGEGRPHMRHHHQRRGLGSPVYRETRSRRGLVAAGRYTAHQPCNMRLVRVRSLVPRANSGGQPTPSKDLSIIGLRLHQPEPTHLRTPVGCRVACSLASRLLPAVEWRNLGDLACRLEVEAGFLVALDPGWTAPWPAHARGKHGQVRAGKASRRCFLFECVARSGDQVACRSAQHFAACWCAD